MLSCHMLAVTLDLPFVVGDERVSGVRSGSVWDWDIARLYAMDRQKRVGTPRHSWHFAWSSHATACGRFAACSFFSAKGAAFIRSLGQRPRGSSNAKPPALKARFIPAPTGMD